MTDPVRKSILLVEDEENLHDALRLNLELENYQVTSAYDGNQALKAISDEYFDLVILDVMLPGIDGISVAETIRVQAKPGSHSYSERPKHQCRPGAGIKKRCRRLSQQTLQPGRTSPAGSETDRKK